MVTNENLLVGSTVWLEMSGPMRVESIDGGFAWLVSLERPGAGVSIGLDVLLRTAKRIDPPAAPADLGHLPESMVAAHREIEDEEHDDKL